MMPRLPRTLGPAFPRAAGREPGASGIARRKDARREGGPIFKFGNADGP